jgi:hypothetical protein
MDNHEQQWRKRMAQQRQVAQRNRAGRLRGRVIATSLICFALLWGAVFVQMATGNDPVLGEKTAAKQRPATPRHRARAEATSRANESEVETAPAREPEVESEPEVEVQPESEPEVEVQPESEPEVEVQPEPEPEVELEPLTTGQS